MSQINLQAPQTWTNNSSNALTINGSVINRGNSLTIGGPGNTAVAGSLSGNGGLTKAGAGTLTMTGANTLTGNVTVGAGALTVASTGSLAMGGYGTLYVGSTGPAGMTVQDSASISTSELDVNYQNTGAGASTLTITGGSLAVSGQSYIGRAPMHADPSTTSAAVYQSGGVVGLNGVTVGYNGTATSLYDISGGVLNTTAGLTVGGNFNNGSGQGNGLVNIHGSAAVNVSGGSGLQIGQDTTLATAGSVNLSGGTLAVVGNVTFGDPNGYVGQGSLNRTGGVMTVSGNLIVDGNATVLLDDTSGSVATSFSGSLIRNGQGTLVIVPQHGDLNSNEALSVATNPAPSGLIVGPWAVRQLSGSDSSGDYLTAIQSGSSYRLTTVAYSGTNLLTATASSVVNVTTNTNVTQKVSLSAVKFGPCVTTLSGTGQLSIGSGGLIVNGGTLAGGNVSFSGLTPYLYAGSSVPGRISSSLTGDLGLVKFGAGSLVLAGNNSGLSGAIAVTAGTLSAQNSWALGGGGTGSPVNISGGACLALQNSLFSRIRG